MGYDASIFYLEKKNVAIIVLTDEEQKSSSEKKPSDEDNGSCLYDGLEQIIYWSDVNSEISFIVPSLRQQSILRRNIGK